MGSYEKVERADVEGGRESEEAKRPTEDFLFPQEMIMQIQRDRQVEPLQEQFELFPMWREEEKDQLGKMLLADTFTNQTMKMEKWEQARFYPGGTEFGPAPDVSKGRSRESVDRPPTRSFAPRSPDGPHGGPGEASCEPESSSLRNQAGIPTER